MEIPESFSSYWHSRSIKLVRFAAWFSLASSVLLGFADKYYLPKGAAFLFWFRLLVMAPGCALGVYLAYSRFSEKVYPVLAALCVAVNLGFLVVYLKEGAYITFGYFAVTIQSLIFLFILFRVPFKWAAPAGFLILLSYWVPLFFVHEDLRAITYFFVLGGVSASMFGYIAWAKEQEERRHYKLLLQLEASHEALVDEQEARADTLRDITKYIGHEVSNFVHIARGALAIEKDVDQLERINDSLDGINQVVDAASDAASLADAIRLEEITNCDLGQIAEAVSSSVQDKFVEVRKSGELKLEGNPARLTQMLSAAISNAVSFSAREENVVVSLEGGSSELVTWIENKGPKLPEGIGSIFNAGFSDRPEEDTDSRHMGLGLYVAKTVAEAHGGSIEAHHDSGVTRFTIRLPIS